MTDKILPKKIKKLKLIINADDFGMSEVFNEIILELLERGKITSTTVLVKNFEDASVRKKQESQIHKLADLKNNSQKKVGVGLHLEIVNGNVSENVILFEIESQVEKFKKVFNFLPDHIDIHKPQIFKNVYKILKKYCKENNILYRQLEEVISGTDLKIEEVKYKLLEVRDRSVLSYVELFFHPGKFDPNCKSSLNRDRELDVEKIEKLQLFLMEENFELINYSNFKIKDYINWGKEKALLNNFGVNKWSKAREIWWASVGENIGVEEDGKGIRQMRPVLVLKVLNEQSVLVVPLTSSSKESKYKISVGTMDIGMGQVQNYAVISQLKMLDTKRLDQKKFMVDETIFEEIKKAIRNLF